jgi:predicted DNA-binding transcriptional regulator AlpA
MATARHPRPSRASQGPALTLDQVRALGTTTDLRTAGAIFGLSANTAYELVRRGQFPVPVIRAGRQYRVSVAAILAVLDPSAEPAAQPPPMDTG